jgi:hypothetical protein
MLKEHNCIKNEDIKMLEEEDYGRKARDVKSSDGIISKESPSTHFA